MKNNAKRILAMAVIMTLCLSLCAFGAQNTATLRIEGCQSTLYAGELPLPQGGHLLDAVKTVLDHNAIPYTIVKSSYGGMYISEIGGEREGMFGGWEGWQYTVNGLSPSVSASDYIIKPNDEVVFYYGDFSSTSAPIINVSSVYPYEGDEFTLTVTKAVDVYGEDWSYIGTDILPVENAVVTFDGEDFITDKLGKATIPSVSKGAHSYSVKKDIVGSYPELIRTGEKKVYVSAVLPVRVTQAQTADGVEVSIAAGGITNAHIAYMIKDGNRPVSCEIKPINLSTGYKELVSVPAGCTLKCTVVTGFSGIGGSLGKVVGAG